MGGIEKLWRAERQLEGQTEGKQCLITRTGGYLSVKMDDSCLVACHFAMVRNQKTRQYHAGVEGCLRTFSGCCNETQLEQLSEEIGGPSAPVRELEAAQLSVSEEKLQEFIQELEQ